MQILINLIKKLIYDLKKHSSIELVLRDENNDLIRIKRDDEIYYSSIVSRVVPRAGETLYLHQYMSPKEMNETLWNVLRVEYGCKQIWVDGKEMKQPVCSSVNLILRELEGSDEL